MKTNRSRSAKLVPIASLLFVGVALFSSPARGQDRPVELFAGLEPSFADSEIGGSDVRTGFRLGVGYFWQKNFSAELSMSLRSASGTGSEVDSRAALDTSVLYHLGTSARWRPYIGAGLHYSRVDDDRSASALHRSADGAAVAAGDEDGLGLLFAGGVNWHLFRRAAVRFDFRYVPVTISGDRDQDSDFVSSIGIGFRF